MSDQDVLDGRFRILAPLKEGGTSRIYKAEDLARGDLVALKIPKEVFARDAEFLERLKREEEIGLRRLHPALVGARPAERKSRPYLVLDFVDGEALDARLAARGPLEVEDAVRIARPVLDALGALHAAGVVHRDVTPRNILLAADGEVRLADLGAAARAGAPEDEGVWGTPAYMAPERVEGQGSGARADLYGVGLVLYEALTGVLPFGGTDPLELMYARLTEAPIAPSAFRPELPAALEDVVLRALRKDPEERFASAAEMKKALERAARAPARPSLGMSRMAS